MKPAVSIITPTYNRGHLLPRVWQSLRQQTESHFQWIIVDDGSTDDTRQVVEDFADPRITYIWQNNTGVNGARNRGDKEIQADYVIYLDSDDELFRESTLQEMLTEIQGTRPDIAWVAFTVVDSEGKAHLYHLPADRLETHYLDHVCEQKLRGEFFAIYRRDATELAAWPPYNGLEALRHWRILKHRSALLINRPARIYHTQSGDNLTGAHAGIRRAASMAAATEELITDHQSVWLQHCPCQLGKYRFYKAMYLALSTTGFRAIPDVFLAIWYGDARMKSKTVLLLMVLFLPIKARQWLFLKRATL
ncbi:glycosyltransferase family 2 protein [Salinisphaera sp. G21_0]|uniref:glycosyltransferase family 2 protein n=1 Tax=Salinisphaera sp. G21_0 TaxID=2821094 RepID=UPI001ADA359C|nr:glycosyltransferase family 2 protein [Salinisphaera sp. G21_0]MBO9480321.1 glycosyltransferase family 2 protein [Salinisphaera sp. G21_0]